MYRSAAARSLFRAAASSNASVARSTLPRSVFKAQLTSSARQSVRLTSPSLALAARKPVTTALVRYATTSTNAERVRPNRCFYTSPDRERVERWPHIEWAADGFYIYRTSRLPKKTLM